jgi:V8-like Glu-specific endopeptidase
MKKSLFIIALFFAFTASCIGQDFDVKRLGVYDLNKVKTFLKDNLASLDPIEGIYSVSLTRNTHYEDGSGTSRYSYSYKCVIIRYGSGFYLKKITNDDGYENVYDANISRIGESNIYDIKLEYTSGYTTDNSRKIASGRIDMSSLFRFILRTSMSYYFPSYTYNDEFDFIKEYPTPSMYEDAIIQTEESKLQAWTGTGYAISNGYIVTNYHVAGEAKTISVKGIKGDMNTGYTAEMVASDKTNDIAILRITDPNFKGFGTIPYAVQQRMADAGEDVFVLGYPLTQALGNEIKLTNGIISSRTGFQGDISTYQMSAPVQPGNSGGPMFDSKGNVIGIVVAGVPGAENVGYAIKTSYLKILIESAGLNITFPSNNTISTLSLAEKVKRVKNFVFYIECSK